MTSSVLAEILDSRPFRRFAFVLGGNFGEHSDIHISSPDQIRHVPGSRHVTVIYKGQPTVYIIDLELVALIEVYP